MINLINKIIFYPHIHIFYFLQTRNVIFASQYALLNNI